MVCAVTLCAHAVCGAGASRTGAKAAGHSLTHYVDPFIGTSYHGHVFLGANVPFGFVQLGPTQYNQGWDWCSGYHYSDSTLIGFSHTHLSGTGCGDLGDLLFLPKLQPNAANDVRFSHEHETARPGYYAVRLADGIEVELTATLRTGLHTYRFPATATQPTLRVNLKRGIGWDSWQRSAIQMLSDTVMAGHRISRGWAPRQHLYYYAVLSRPVVSATFQDDTIAQLTFAPGPQPLKVRVGLSAVSVDNARLNLEAESPHWDFGRQAAQADSAWQLELQRIAITGATPQQRRIFYTALYHTMIAPSVFCDVNGQYRGSDEGVYQASGYTNLTTFSLWDTYRALHPLFTLIRPDMQHSFAQTMINIYRQQGRLPVWHLMGNETDCMVGNPAIPVLADIVMKGFPIDRRAAFEAMKASAMLDIRSMGLLKQYGYIPYDKEPSNETTAKGLEYAIADGGIAKVARILGDTVASRYFLERSKSYARYFDPHTCFMRGLSSTGRFSEPFNPFRAVPGKGDYTEGNAWQYAWLVPHDVKGLMSLFGSERRFAEKLDSLFVIDGDMGKDAAPDVSGLIGQYAHGNEPSHHIIYLYNYAGQPWKAASRLRQVMNTLYTDLPDGLCGNEDVGQMSAWYVLSSVGLYQVDPSGGCFVIGSPLFGSASINVGGGKTFRVVARDNSAKNIYVQSVRLNGQPYSKSYVTFSDIARGGVLELQMGSKPSRTWGVKPGDRP